MFVCVCSGWSSGGGDPGPGSVDPDGAVAALHPHPRHHYNLRSVPLGSWCLSVRLRGGATMGDGAGVGDGTGMV